MVQISSAAKKVRVNRQIRAREVRLIDQSGNQVGIVSLREALEASNKADVDLVEVNPTSRPPICKLMDYGKYRYEQSKKERESRLNRKTISIKEVKFRPKIDEHDYQTKKKMVVKFLKAGDKVKITLMFRGREVMYRKQGMEMLKKLAEEVSELGTREGLAKAEGRNTTMIITPRPQTK